MKRLYVKNDPEMTYVSSGTLNSTLPFYISVCLHSVSLFWLPYLEALFLMLVYGTCWLFWFEAWNYVAVFLSVISYQDYW